MAKILIADDEEDYLTAMSIRLQHAGHDCVCVQDGEAVLKIIPEEKPDLIILDIMMPKLDGFQTLQSLKANPETESIPVIFLTAGHLDFSETLDDLAVAHDLLLKTTSTEEILKSVEKMLEPSSSA